MIRNYWNGPKGVIGVATIIDVAKRAGVSRSTVSLVINKSPLVKDDTRQLVEREAPGVLGSPLVRRFQGMTLEQAMDKKNCPHYEPKDGVKPVRRPPIPVAC